MNHVAVDRCYQCGTSFAVDDRTLETVEVGAATAASASVHGERTPAPGAARRQPSLAPLEPTPIAFSDRMEAGTERVAIPAADGQPLKPFAEAAPATDGGDDVDWMDPRHEHAARQGMRVQRRNRMVHAMLGIIVLCVVAAGGYYAYDSGALPRVADVARALELNDDSKAAAPAAARPGEGVARSDASVRPATSEPDASAATATDSAAALATPPATNPSTASMTPVTTETPTPAANPSTPPEPELATERPVQSASEPSVPVARTHGATARRTLRNASPKPSRSANAQTTSDKDALATQRLIERDLAGFLGADASHGGPPR